MNEPFIFYTRFNLVRLLGIKVCSPAELLVGIKSVPLSSIYYHTHRFLQQHNCLSPEPPNDFAYWLTNTVNMKELGEAFASIDTVSYDTLEGIRSVFVNTLENYLSKGRQSPLCAPGEEFHFMSCTTFVISTGSEAAGLAELADNIKKISVDSLYYHMFEARLRLGKGGNDFARWCDSINEKTLAAQLRKLDPYTCTLETLRARILYLISEYAEH
ncbi:MAG TPA: DUF5752 family protein [bacterium]